MNIAVIGGGPAGLAAAAAARSTARVSLFERNEKLGKKLYITGKGRCNLTNLVDRDTFMENVVNGKKFLFAALTAMPPQKTVEFFENNGLKLKVERGRRVFPASDKASDVTKILEKVVLNRGVRIIYKDVLSVTATDDGRFMVNTNEVTYRFDKVILACGGMSYPSTGSNGDGYKIASSLGHTVIEPVPALVSLKLNQDVTGIEGLSLKNVTAKIAGNGFSAEQFGEMLFTHDGVSGPIILTLTSLINRKNLSGAALFIDLKPALSKELLDARVISDFKKARNKVLKNSLDELLPKSLIPYVIDACGIDPLKPVNSITKEERGVLVSALKGLPFGIKGLGSFNEAIITSGGVDLREVNPKTMESKKVKGLFFAGEMLDIDAFTGGYNIQIALSTGYSAGLAAGQEQTDKDNKQTEVNAV